VVHLAFARGHGALFVLAVAALALGLAALFYRQSAGALPRGKWLTLYGLRAASIVVVLLLLFRPVLSLERDLRHRRSVVLLLDTSASMATTDDPAGLSRLERARRKVAAWSGALNRDLDLRPIAFADTARALESPGDLADLKADGPATSFTRALNTAATTASKDDIAAVVLFSDGLHNTAGDPLAAAKRMGSLVHTVGVGDARRAGGAGPPDVRLDALECPETLPVNNRAKVSARVAQTGLDGRVLTASLEEDGQPVATAEVVLPPAGGTRDVAFEFVPKVKGRHAYTVRLPNLPDESIPQNNSRTAPAQVVDARLKVLYLEGTLRAEYGAIVQRFLSKDPDIDFCALVQTRPGVYLQRTNIDGLALKGLPDDPETLAKFDVIVIGDLDAAAWGSGQLDRVAARVREGAGLLMLGGYHSFGPGGYGGTALEPILPVVPGPRDIGQRAEPFLPVLTPDGANHPIFAGIAPFFPTPGAPAKETGLPPLDGCTRVVGPAPGATVLAVAPGEGTPMPVLAVQPVGKGRAVAFTADTTRNWQQTMRALDQETPFLRFWGQVVRWLANRTEGVKAEAGVTARTDRPAYEPDTEVAILAVVRDRDGEGTDAADVSAAVTGPGAPKGPVPLVPVPGNAGHYRGAFEPSRPGAYVARVVAKVDGQAMTAPEAPFEVGRPNLEFDRLDLDDARLAAIAGATGGQYQHLSTADRLLDTLDRAVRKEHVVLERRLAAPWPGWGLVVVLLTAEWILRRRYALR
jgi:uncharacterized membrane protein